MGRGANIAVEVAARGRAELAGLMLVEGNVGSYAEVFAGTEWTPPDPTEDVPPGEVLPPAALERLIAELDEVQAAIMRRSVSPDHVVHPTPAEKLARSLAAWQQPLTHLYDQMPPTIETVLVRASDGFGDGSPIATKAIDEHLARLLRRHPEFKVQRLPCGHAIPYFLPAELALTISVFARRALQETPSPSDT